MTISPGLASADVQYLYDSAGRMIQATYSNGVVVQYRYDAAGNRQQIIATGPPNQSPVANNDAASVVASASVVVAVLANDSDPDANALTVTGVSAVTGGGTAAISGGGTSITYAASATTGPKTFTYTISDGAGGTATATVTVTVTAPPNTAPVANNDTASVTTLNAVVIPVLTNDTDANGDALTVTAVSAVTGGGTAVVSGGGTTVTYTASSTTGSRTFTYTVSDSHGGTSTATVTVTVNAPPADLTPDPVDWNDTTWTTGASYGGNATNNVTISGINQPISLTFDVTTVTENFDDGYVYVYVNGSNAGSVHYAAIGPGSMTVTVSNGDQVSLYIDGVTSSGIRSGSARINVTNSSTGGTFLDTFAFEGIVDNDNNYNTADLTPDAVNWSDTTWSTGASYGGNATNNVTISGINQPISLTVDVTTVTTNFADGYVYAYVNGSNVGSVHYPVSGPGSFTLTVSNGDQVSFYIDGVTTYGIRSGSARINIYNNSTGGTFLDTFAFEGIVDNDNNYNLPP